MSLRSYLFIMSLMTALCAAVFGYIVITVDPETTNTTGFFLFYLSLLLLIVGMTAIIGFVIRFIIFRHELVINTVKIAFRQSFIFAVFIVASLILLSRDLLSWLNLGILIIGLSALEFFLLSYGKTNLDVIADNSSDIVIPAQAGIQEGAAGRLNIKE